MSQGYTCVLWLLRKGEFKDSGGVRISSLCLACVEFFFAGFWVAIRGRALFVAALKEASREASGIGHRTRGKLFAFRLLVWNLFRVFGCGLAQICWVPLLQERFTLCEKRLLDGHVRQVHDYQEFCE